MIGAYHEERERQMEQSREGYGDVTMPDTPAQTATAHQPAQAPTPGASGAGDTTGSGSGSGSGDVHPDVAARNDVTYSVSDEDTDWQFCEQCQGLFEPDGEYDAHFESPGFDCVRGAE